MGFLVRMWRRSPLGLAMLSAGFLLLMAAGLYYGYVTFIAPRGSELLTVGPSNDTGETLDPTNAGSPGALALYPGVLMPARQWADPRGSLDLPQPNLAGFIPISATNQPSLTGPGTLATHLSIPEVNIDADVEEIAIKDLGDASEYVTPAFTVGHIPGTPNPGSHGNGWYFGHLESPIQGQGNVFSRLPKIADLLRNGEDIYVILSVPGRDYLYAVTQTDLVGENDLALYQSDDARITLVTCYPRLLYNQRLLVTAELRGFRDTTK